MTTVDAWKSIPSGSVDKAGLKAWAEQHCCVVGVEPSPGAFAEVGRVKRKPGGGVAAATAAAAGTSPASGKATKAAAVPVTTGKGGKRRAVEAAGGEEEEEPDVPLRNPLLERLDARILAALDLTTATDKWCAPLLPELPRSLRSAPPFLATLSRRPPRPQLHACRHDAEWARSKAANPDSDEKTISRLVLKSMPSDKELLAEGGRAKAHLHGLKERLKTAEAEWVRADAAYTACQKEVTDVLDNGAGPSTAA